VTRKGDAKVADLAGVTLFAGCTGKELSAIAKLTCETQAAPGQVVCKEGEAGLECFVIVEGEAEVTMAGTPIATIGPGSFLGEMALLDRGPRVATVTATTPMRLLALSRTEFDALLVTVPEVSRRMLAIMGSRLRVMDEIAKAAKLANVAPSDGPRNP